MSHSTLPDCEPNSTSTSPEQPGVLVVRKHHFPVRWSHWLNIPILLGLMLSGISIYWASQIYQHKPDPNTGNFDVAADIGVWICAHVPGLHHYSNPPDWVYNHMSLGPGMLALALPLPGLRMSRKSQETIGPSAVIPATTESNVSSAPVSSVGWNSGRNLRRGYTVLGERCGGIHCRPCTFLRSLS